jgi:hypothetical protein
MAKSTQAYARYDTRTRSSAAKITPASSTGLREHHLTCPCCEQGFTLELPAGYPDPGAHCFQCRQECDWPGQCHDLSTTTPTVA